MERTLRRQAPALVTAAVLIPLLSSPVMAQTPFGSAGVGVQRHAADAAGQPVIAVPATIDGTGGRDVTQELNDFLASVPNGSTVLLQPRARYRVDGTIRLVDRRGLTVDGQGATLFARLEGDRNRRHVTVLGGADVTLRNLVVRGTNPHAGVSQAAYRANREAQHAFEFLGVQGALLESNEAYDVFGDFVYLGPRGAEPSRDVVVRGNTFARNGRQGIAMTGADGVLVEGNSISDTRRATIDFEPNYAHTSVTDVVIRDNDFGRGRLLFVAAHGRGPVNDITIEGNRLVRGLNSSVQSPAGQRRTGWRLVDNVALERHGNPSGAAITVARVDDVVVTGNAQPLQAGRNMVLVRLTDVCRATVDRNQLPGGVGQSRTTVPCTAS